MHHPWGPSDLQVLHTSGDSGQHGLCTGRLTFFTGDTLFVEAVGPTDSRRFPQAMCDSIQSRLCTLPDDTVVLPGHHYGSEPTSTIGHEKRFNPFLR
jgi:glyoxylase-like metal-dependent hydrolase (beta-lactamase superfamily II)